MKERPAFPSLEHLRKGLARFDRARRDKKNEDSQTSDVATPGINAGYELFASTCFGTAAGFALDKWLGTLPLFMVAGLILGAVAGFRALIARNEPEAGKEQPTDSAKPNSVTKGDKRP